MSFQTGLEDFKAGHLDEQDISISESVRNVNYHMMTPDELSNGQRIVLEELLRNPDGTNDKGIAVNTGLPLSSVCARRNELIKLELVEPVSIGFYPDYKGRFRPNIMWGIVIR